MNKQGIHTNAERLVSSGVCYVVCKDSNIQYSILLVCLNILCSVVHRQKHFKITFTMNLATFNLEMAHQKCGY